MKNFISKHNINHIQYALFFYVELRFPILRATYLLQIAPMVDWTNSPFRLLMRLMLPKAKLFTEMLTPQAIIRHPKRFLDYFSLEHPLVLQLGGSCPNELLQASLIAQSLGYDEININLGCPSPRVQSGGFGACLMTEKKQVLECISLLKANIQIPITAKTRIGVDNHDSYAFFEDFVAGLVEAGVDEVVVHARKALLKGLSPKENRTVPPIQYEYVYQIKQQFRSVPFIINGDIKSLSEILMHLEQVDGVMLGRLALNNPYEIRAIYQKLYHDNTLLTREHLWQSYIELLMAKSLALPISFYLKPLFNLYHGTIDSKKWKQLLMAAQAEKSFNLILKSTDFNKRCI